jgi:hypothetical protein
MAREVLAVPEQHLEDFIKVIRAGLSHTDVDEEVREQLTDWCDDEEAHLQELAEDSDAEPDA